MDYARSTGHACESRPIHVLTLTPFYPSESDEIDGSFVAEPLEYFSDFNVISTVIAAKPISWGTFKSSERGPKAIRVRYPQLPGRLAYGSWGLLLYARLAHFVSLLHRNHPIDLIHAQSALPCGHAAALLSRQLRIPFLVTIHGLDVFSTRREKGLLRRWVNRSSRFVYRNAARSICVSEAVRRVLVDTMGSLTKPTVIYNGVNTSRFSPPRNDAEDSIPTILSVGRLVPDKGHELVIRAVAELAPNYPCLRYQIIDDGPERSRLVALSHELKIAERVEVVGRQSRRAVAEAMQRCSVFALPSQDEAMGCVYLEAMATGKPIIGCRHQGIEEIVRHGENGWLIQPGNVQELAQAIAVLLRNKALRKEIGLEARRTIIGGLTLKHQAARLNRLYRECLSSADRDQAANYQIARRI
ncbi:MAG TPA: glycosyltransferase [Pyrinomonadaceae bacterium]|nr:glycosyltransferase [Pyrinomonadaceae bacterium]